MSAMTGTRSRAAPGATPGTGPGPRQCSPRSPPSTSSWLLYAVQPKNARPGLRPGACKGAAHRPHNLGYGGRRVLVSRWWSGKTLTDHRADRRAFALAILAEQHAAQRPADAGLPDPNGEPDRYTWEYAKSGDPDVPPLAERIGRALSERIRW